jgi:mannose-6-phosphate isomerase-like protein (cupin superfamily)
MHHDGETTRTAHLEPESGLRWLSDPEGRRSVAMFEHGSLVVELYAPRGTDQQTPHSRDELYVVVRGRGIFYNGTARRDFAPGDLLFVAAGVTHRFEEFTDDMAVWVVFFGPEGGEDPEMPTAR